VGNDFNITARPVTVTANNGLTKVYGFTDPALGYAITSGSLVNGDGFTGVLSRITGENVGSYSLNAGTLSLGGNYTLTIDTAGKTLNVTPRALTLRPNSVTRVFGTANPANYSYAIVGGSVLNTDLLGTATYTVPWNDNTPAGTVSYTMSGLSNPNYVYTYQAGEFIITPSIAVIPDSNIDISSVDVPRIISGAAERNPLFAYTLILSASDQMRNPTKNLQARTGTQFSIAPSYNVDGSLYESPYKLEYKEGWLRYVSVVKDTPSGEIFAALYGQQNQPDDTQAVLPNLSNRCENTTTNSVLCAQVAK
jgi:hypothetical protein